MNMFHVRRHRKGFTLIELLVVIGIVVILSVVVILTLNPAQLLRQARDSNRISDLSTLKSALALYLSDVTSPSLGTWANCYMYATSSVTPCAPRFVNGGTTNNLTSTAVTGTGWIPVAFSGVSGGSPISAEPVDPVNNATYFYAYKASSTALTFKLTADMESTKYGNTGASDVETPDGGASSSIYEVGTDLTF